MVPQGRVKVGRDKVDGKRMERAETRAEVKIDGARTRRWRLGMQVRIEPSQPFDTPQPGTADHF